MRHLLKMGDCPCLKRNPHRCYLQAMNLSIDKVYVLLHPGPDRVLLPALTTLTWSAPLVPIGAVSIRARPGAAVSLLEVF